MPVAVWGAMAEHTPSASATHHLYKSKHWAMLRNAVLVRDVYQCQRCGVLLSGRYPADNSPVVNHRVPHKGDAELFHDLGNLEAVCKSCHDGDVQSSERVGYSSAIGDDGWPIDGAHPANRV